MLVLALCLEETRCICAARTCSSPAFKGIMPDPNLMACARRRLQMC